MSVFASLEGDLTKAIKERDQEMVSVLRMLKSAIKNLEISKGGEITETEYIALLEKQVKQRNDSAEQYRNGNRIDLAEKEEREIVIISKYLPEKLSYQEAESIVVAVISALGATTIKDMGAVMKAVAEKAQGRVDGKTLSEIVKSKLT